MPVDIPNAFVWQRYVVINNEYLTERDATEMGRTLLMTLQQKSPAEKNSYLCDITYSTNSEIGFDYCANMVVCAAVV